MLMNIADILLILLIAFLLFLAIRAIRSGKSGTCRGDCSKCALANCGQKQTDYSSTNR